MLVLDSTNSYTFSNMVIRLTDNTVITEDETEALEAPAFTMLIPTVQDIGPTNTMELYRPGQLGNYLSAHGDPNCVKYGFGPDFIHAILSRPESDVSVYTVNLRGPDATNANCVVLLKYRVEEDVPYTDDEGNPYYLNSRGEVTLEPTDAEPIVRNVLHVRYDTVFQDDVRKWTELYKRMNIVTDEEDEEGYKTIPWFAFMYRGCGAFGNNVYISMTPTTMEYDGNVYYALRVFDGTKTTTTDITYSLDTLSGAKYAANYYIEHLFNNDANFKSIRFQSSENVDMIYQLYNQYLYTLDDYVNGTTDSPSVTYPNIDPFTYSNFAVVVDEGSLVSTRATAFQLRGGTDGDYTRDQLFEMFYRGEIIEAIGNVIQYRFNYIPDIGYNDTTKDAINDLVTKRLRTTVATFMLGTEDTYMSAVNEHMSKWFETAPCIRQLCKAQSPMMFNDFVHRTVTYPCSYFDTVSLVDHFARYGNFFHPFAGAGCRWTGYIEDTIMFPPDTVEVANLMANNRINYVMRDGEDGAYLNDQQMNTRFLSDQTEFNNSLLISCMLYDLIQLVHENTYQFNEAEEVRIFQNAVDTVINGKYSQHAASMSIQVYRMGTVGRAKAVNKIIVTIDLKDISKYADVELVLVDE